MQEIIKKLLSGRFWLTIITGFVFAYAVMTGKIAAEATASIITAVFVSYFNRRSDDGTTIHSNNGS